MPSLQNSRYLILPCLESATEAQVWSLNMPSCACFTLFVILFPVEDPFVSDLSPSCHSGLLLEMSPIQISFHIHCGG
jgi:hypothetical protein